MAPARCPMPAASSQGIALVPQRTAPVSPCTAPVLSQCSWCTVPLHWNTVPMHCPVTLSQYTVPVLPVHCSLALPRCLGALSQCCPSAPSALEHCPGALPCHAIPAHRPSAPSALSQCTDPLHCPGVLSRCVGALSRCSRHSVPVHSPVAPSPCTALPSPRIDPALWCRVPLQCPGARAHGPGARSPCPARPVPGARLAAVPHAPRKGAPRRDRAPRSPGDRAALSIPPAGGAPASLPHWLRRAGSEGAGKGQRGPFRKRGADWARGGGADGRRELIGPGALPSRREARTGAGVGAGAGAMEEPGCGAQFRAAVQVIQGLPRSGE